MIKSNKALHNTCCGFLLFLSVAKLSLCIHARLNTAFVHLKMASNSYDHTIIFRSNYLRHSKDVCLFVCFVALRPKSTAMVIAGRSVHLTTLFPGQA